MQGDMPPKLRSSLRRGRGDLYLQQIQHVAHRLETLQFLVRKADAKSPFNLRNDAHHVQGIETEVVAKFHAVVKLGIFLTLIRFKKLDERPSNRLTISTLFAFLIT